MEIVAPKRKKFTVYICLGIILLLTFVSITLIMAKGFDSKNFFDKATWPLACLPISLTVPVFVAFDFFAHVYHPDDPEVFCPLAPEGVDKGRKYAFVYAMLATIVTILLFFAFNENAKIEAEKASLIFLIPTLPTLLAYVYPLIHPIFEEKRENDGALCIAILTAAIAGAGLLIFGLTRKEPTYLYGYIVYPLCVVVLMMYKRGD